MPNIFCQKAFENVFHVLRNGYDDTGFYWRSNSDCKKDYELATRQLLMVYDIAGKRGSIRFQLDVIYLMTRIYLNQGQIHKARRLLMDGKRLISRGSDLNLEKLRIFRLQAQMHFAANDYELGAFYQNKYKLKDSVYDNGLMTRLMEIESEFQERENKELIARQNEMLGLKEEVIVSQKHVTVLIGFLTVITMALLILIFRNYLRKRKDNTILDQLITERTNQAEINCNSLLSELDEKDLIIDRVSSGIKELVATLHALRSTATSEGAGPLARQRDTTMRRRRLSGISCYLGRLQRVERHLRGRDCFQLDWDQASRTIKSGV